MEEFEKFYNRTLRFLSYRPRSEKEIKDFLAKKKVNPLIISKILKKLREQNLVNNREFARWWVEQRLEFRPQALWLTKRELRQKGIDEGTIEKILRNYDIKKLGEEGARKLVEKRITRYRGLSREETYQKLSQFLARRGFDWETIKKAIDPDSIGVDELLEK